MHMCAGKSIGNALCNDSPVTITGPFTRYFTMLARPIALPTRFYLVISLVHDPVVDLLSYSEQEWCKDSLFCCAI